MSNFIFNANLENYLLSIKQKTPDIVSIRPLEPPYVQVVKEKHTVKQKLGSLLSKEYSPELVKSLVEEYKEINGDLSKYKISYSTEYVEIYKYPLYAIGATDQSCMTDKDCVRIYSYDDRLSLLLIYKNSKLVGRTLVREDTMKYIRLYIDHNEIKPHIARAIVLKEGYVGGDLEGIRLDYIEIDDETIVCPYLDGISSFRIINNNYLEIDTYGNLSADSTEGYVALENKFTCDCCGDREPVEEMICVGDLCLCEYCVDQNYVFYNGEYHKKEDCVVNNSTDELVPLDSEDISCTEDGDWFNSDEIVSIDGCNYHIDDTIYNSEELEYLPKGNWLRVQIEEVIEEMYNKLSQLQTDLFEDKEVLEISNEEINTLTIELNKIGNLL